VTSGRPAIGRARSGAIVVDASITAAWCFDDEVSPFTEAALDEVVRGGALVPAVWFVEMANVLVVAHRRGRVDPERADRLMATLLTLPVMVDDGDHHVLGPSLLRVARAQGLTAYDAAYVELAARARLPLATRDAALREAAGRAGVDLFEA
jgi:predicted nucleic acid-binding protein